ncbi:MAG: septum formation initiator family protein [Sphingobacteriales bacterium]|nr:septum formation initiator family protein [Sphingobacteriales bacterium]
MWQRILRFFKNKYYMSLLAFLVWMLLFDRNDIFTQYQHITKLNSLRQNREYYIVDIQKLNKDIIELNTNQLLLEKFAREKYLMKKDNEDVYVIVR